MTKTILKTFAITIAFACSAIAISLFMWTLDAAGYEVVAGQQVDDWFKQGVFTLAYALLAGFLVDSIRWLTAVAWVPARRRVIGHKLRKRHASQVCLSD